MELERIVNSERIICNPDDIKSKKRAIELLAQLLSTGTESASSLEIFQNLIDRERLGSTALGNGVALPHSRTKLCTHPVGALIKLKKGIDFDSPDQEPTDLLFGLIVPEHYTDEHLQILASLASMFNESAICRNIRSSSNNTDLFNSLMHWQITSQAS